MKLDYCLHPKIFLNLLQSGLESYIFLQPHQANMNDHALQGDSSVDERHSHHDVS